MFVVDDLLRLPMDLAEKVLDGIVQQIDDEMLNNEASVRKKYMEVVREYESGQMGEEEYRQKIAFLSSRLKELKQERLATMQLNEAVTVMMGSIRNITKYKYEALVGAVKDQETGNWILTIELLEKNSIPDSMDILGIYDATIDDQGDIVELKRKLTRRRCDTISEA